MIDKKIQLTFNNTVNKRVKVRTNCELYSHDKNNNEFELTIGNHTLTNEEIIILFKFVKSIKYWETQGKIEENKIKFKFDTNLITDNERVNCYIILKNEEKESDVYSFSFDVKMSEYDLKDNLPIKERYFANSVVVDKLDVLTKEVLAEELEKAKGTYVLKTDLSEFVRTSDISDVVRTATLNDYQLKSEMPNVTEIVNNTIDSKGFLTTHQSLVDYAKKSELPIDYVSNAKLEELKTQLTIDTSNFATKQELQAISGSQLNVDNLVTKDELNSKNYLTQHQDISNLATKQELQEVSNRQPTVDTSNLVTKDELAGKGYLTQHQSLSDITSRLTTLENRPAGNVDTSNFATKDELNRTTLGYVSAAEFLDYKKASISNYTLGLSVDAYFRQFKQNSDEDNFGKIYNNATEKKVYAGNYRFADLDMVLYTVATALPDGYNKDYFAFGDDDKVKLITNKNIGNYINKDALRYIVKEIMKEK